MGQEEQVGVQSVPERVAADAGLVRRAARGEALAWQQLVDMHAGPLFRSAWWLLGERDAAEDAVQESFLRLWRIAPRWRPDAPVGAWLHRVVVNLARDALRRRRPTVEIDADTADPDPSPEERAASAMEVARLRCLIGELPERQRVALTLCRLEGMSLREAAGVLGCGEESVESLLARARRTLRERLATEEVAAVRRTA